MQHFRPGFVLCLLVRFSGCTYIFNAWQYVNASLSPKALSKVIVHLQYGTESSGFLCRKRVDTELQRPS